MNEAKLIRSSDLKKRFKLRIDWLEKDKHDEYTTGIWDGCLYDAKLIDEMPAVEAIEIPIKVGQIVYMDKSPWREEVEIEPFQITSISITCNKKGTWTKKFRANWVYNGGVRSWSHDPTFDDIGKTVFFTKEDAERILLNGTD